MKYRDPVERRSCGEHEAHRLPSPLEAMGAERIAWSSVLRSLLFFGGTGVLVVSLWIGTSLWDGPPVPLSLHVVVRLVRIGVLGFLGGVAFGAAIFVLVRGSMIVERWLGGGGTPRG